MGMMTFRPGQRLVIPGVQVFAPGVASSAASTWWDNNGAISGCVAAYAAKGATSLAASYTNLTGNATYDAAPGVAPTWDTTGGWTFNGSSQYLLTNVVPAAAYSMIMRFSNRVTGEAACAVSGQNTRFGFDWSGAALIYYYGSGTTGRSVTGNPSSGVVALCATQGYLNGLADGAPTPNIWSGTATQVAIGARNLNGTTRDTFGNLKVQALAIYSVTLTGTQVATITTAMQAL